MVSRLTLHELVELLPDSEVANVETLLSDIARVHGSRTLSSPVASQLSLPVLPCEDAQEEVIRPEFAQSLRRGIAQADAGQVVVCQSYAEMIEKLLD